MEADQWNWDNGSYSPPQINDSYLSQWEEPETALDDWGYWATDVFLKSVLQGDILPSDIADKFDFDDFDPFVDALKDQWAEVLRSNWRVCTATAFGMAMVILIPLMGLFWCFSRCCCMGDPRRSQAGDTFSTIIYSVAFVVFILLSATGLTWYHWSVELMRGGVEDRLTPFIWDSVDDANLYINNTVEEIRHLTGPNLEELTDNFINQIEDTASEFQDIADGILGEEVHFMRLVNMTAFATAMARDFEDTRKPALLDKVQNMTDKITALDAAGSANSDKLT